MTTYLAKTTFGSFRFQADLAQASAPIRSLPDRGDDESEGSPTPYQTADARHGARAAALLVLDYFGTEYWLSPETEVTESDGEDLYDGKHRSDYVASLLVSVEAEPEPEYRAIRVIAAGGDNFRAYLTDHDDGERDEFVGSFTAGDIDDEGQWVGDDDTIQAAAREQLSEMPADLQIRIEC